MSLVGKTVVLTGAATEAGAEIGRMLLDAGAATIGLLDWHGVRLASLADSLAEEFGETRVVSLPTDLTDRTQVRHSLREFSRIAGRIDVLVENTGALIDRSISMLTARGIAAQPGHSWRRELQNHCVGIGQNLRTALDEIRDGKVAHTSRGVVTVTPLVAKAIQDLVSN